MSFSLLQVQITNFLQVGFTPSRKVSRYRVFQYLSISSKMIQQSVSVLAKNGSMQEVDTPGSITIIGRFDNFAIFLPSMSFQNL